MPKRNTPNSPEPPAVLPRVMPFKQAARESGLNYWALRTAHFRGELSIVRFNRAWYVEVAELARFVAEHTERRTPDDGSAPRARKGGAR